MVDQHVDAPAAAVGQPAPAGTPRAPQLPVAPAPANEGKTAAAWTTVTLIVLGAIVVAVGIAAGQHWADWVGVAIILLGLVVGGIMRKAGFGQPTRRR